MGNAIGAKRKTAKVMKIDGTTIRFKAPATANDVIRDHPGYSLLESDEVRQLGIRARPLPPEQPLKPGRLYFLVELPRLPDQRVPRRAWSGALHVSAKDRLESLMLSRRAVSDLSVGKASAENGAVRLKMKLPRAQVEKLVAESKDSTEAAEKIMGLCVSNKDGAGSPSPTTAPHRREKRTRFLPMADEITV
ncbi:hypothetical protein J5N97_009576 [Dioscorea zingiberensis]|uniref:Plastid movement impaired 2 n=1 Tax=Dioscorea zingiberensis TaxID=325984 RepID=A0A9D5CWN5_9LILI|nr:hypothetical protein J5N97_009560 [Dioscorea zingiberensis]KAJ0981321.1 hypothetical protein J5N97_009576 [Dioscorea zingiberensis]